MTKARPLAKLPSQAPLQHLTLHQAHITEKSPLVRREIKVIRRVKLRRNSLLGGLSGGTRSWNPEEGWIFQSPRNRIWFYKHFTASPTISNTSAHPRTRQPQGKTPQLKESQRRSLFARGSLTEADWSSWHKIPDPKNCFKTKAYPEQTRIQETKPRIGQR